MSSTNYAEHGNCLRCEGRGKIAIGKTEAECPECCGTGRFEFPGMKIYCFSTNEELFHSNCVANSFEMAVATAEGELCLDDGQEFFVGIRDEVRPETHLHGHQILENIAESIDDEVGEVSEGWPDANDEEVADLERRLRSAFVEWMRETGNEPRFYKVIDVQSFVAGEQTASTEKSGTEK